MSDFIDRVGAERAWAATVVVVFGALIIGVLAFPQRVYVDFLWQYYWGPVVADAYNWNCVAWADGAQLECTAAGSDAGPTASPGYTFVSYAGYVPTLILLLVGIYYLLERLEIERYRVGFYALFPFMLFGGALRVVEDANATAFSQTGELAIPMPYSGFLISPLIYFTVFVVALLAVVVSVLLDRRGYVSGYEYPLAGIGGVALATTLGYLGFVAATEDYASFYPSVSAIVLVGATITAAVVWLGLERYRPEWNRGTAYMGIVVIWAHAVDGVANWLMLDWAHLWDLQYGSKHPINELLFDYTSALLPGSVVDVIGAGWPFYFVKIAAAVGIIWVFNEEFFEDSPRFAILLMITVVAVGLGPGSRDMIRATFGI